jgi:hypothetical protein
MSVRFTLTNLILGTAVVLPVSLVSAADQFYREDANRDGVLSGREAKDLLMLDENKDREISQAEFTAAARKQRAQAVIAANLLFEIRDENQDRRLSGTEMAGIEYFDKNGDRRISKLEFKTCLVNGDPSILDASGATIRKIATERFKKMDTNEDDRVSGTEAESLSHFDQNQDGRLTIEEYITGLILCGEVADSLSPDDAIPTAPNTPIADDEVHKAYASFITALHDIEKVDLIQDWLHESIKHQIDDPILDYALKHAKKSHGDIGLPPKNEIRIASVEGGDIRAEADLRCKKGKLKLVLQFKEGRMNGFLMDSPEMQGMDKALYRDLQKDELQKVFSRRYGIEASFVLTRIMNGEDALSDVHPSVVEQVGHATFEKLFEQFRTKVGKLNSYEVESFKTELDENDVYSFTVTHIVTGTGVPQRFSTTFQVTGMEAAITGLEISDAADVVPTPEPDPKPMGPSVAEVTATWTETVSLKDGLAFKAPAEAVRTEQDSPGGHLTRFVVEQPEEKLRIQVDLIRLKIDVSKEAATFFETTKAAFVKSTGGELLQEEIEHEKGPFPSQMLALKLEDDRIVFLRSVIDGSDYYSFVCTGSGSAECKPKFFAFHESVKLIDAQGALRPGFEVKDLDGDGEPNSEESSTESPAPPAPVAAPAEPITPEPITPEPITPEPVAPPTPPM